MDTGFRFYRFVYGLKIRVLVFLEWTNLNIMRSKGVLSSAVSTVFDYTSCISYVMRTFIFQAAILHMFLTDGKMY